jgi:hypothetical protein
MNDALSEIELEALDHLGKAAGLIRKAIGGGPCADSDWREAAHMIHNLQAFVMSQAAVRAYPERFRPLGGWRA